MHRGARFWKILTLRGQGSEKYLNGTQANKATINGTHCIPIYTTNYTKCREICQYLKNNVLGFVDSLQKYCGFKGRHTMQTLS